MEARSVSTRTVDGARLKAIIFDLDGTLYRQGWLHRAIGLRLIRCHATQPLRGLRTLRALRAYRKAQERLRDGFTSVDLAEAQIGLACTRTNLTPEFMRACVSRWMEHEPLDIVHRCAWPGIQEFLQTCKARGLRLAVVSDYPAEAKLDALGLRGFFDVVLCAQAPEIGVFKPHPRGLQIALERLGAGASETLYVGDRAEVDAVAAAAAGISCAILVRTSPIVSDRAWLQIAGYAELRRLLFPL